MTTSMTMYALGTLPLIQQLKTMIDIEHVWYADESREGGNLMQLHRWWDTLIQLGPAFGYNANPTKCSLVVKEELFVEAEKCFKGTGIQIIPSGKGYLGSTIGNEGFKPTYVKMKDDQWRAELEKLAKIATSQPQAAFCTLTHSIKSKWTYLARTTKNISTLLQPIEDIIRYKIIPTITGKNNINDEERKIFALPARLGGLGIDILPETADHLYKPSSAIAELLKRAIRNNTESNKMQLKLMQMKIKRKEKT